MIYCRFLARTLQPLSDGWKFQDNFANTAGTDSKIIQQLCFSSMRRITSMYHSSDAGASHTAKSQQQKLHFARIWEIKIGPIKFNSYKTVVNIVCDLSCQSRRSKPRNPYHLFSSSVYRILSFVYQFVLVFPSEQWIFSSCNSLIVFKRLAAALRTIMIGPGIFLSSSLLRPFCTIKIISSCKHL